MPNPAQDYGLDLYLPIVIIRRITPDGAILEDIELLSQWADWNAQMKTSDFMEIASQELGLVYDPPETVLCYDIESPDPIITNIYLIKLEGTAADHLRSLLDAFDEMVLRNVFDWLRVVQKLDDGEGNNNEPIHQLVQEIIKKIIFLQIPLNIPLGQCEYGNRPA